MVEVVVEVVWPSEGSHATDQLGPRNALDCGDSLTKSEAVLAAIDPADKEPFADRIKLDPGSPQSVLLPVASDLGVSVMHRRDQWAETSQELSNSQTFCGDTIEHLMNSSMEGYPPAASGIGVGMRCLEKIRKLAGIRYERCAWQEGVWCRCRSRLDSCQADGLRLWGSDAGGCEDPQRQQHEKAPGRHGAGLYNHHSLA
ncbi:MAG: hypothetical protein PHU25_22135 [Deltaproteobacteria bacterium]|nr:hypothetical protein [Deltaproteobacteria bacterium]